MQSDKVFVKVDNKIATVIVDNPPSNSIDPDVIDGLEKAFDNLLGNNVLAVIIASENPKVFIAGADIKQFVSWKKAEGTAVVERGNSVFNKIAGFPSPVICAIDGFAFGGGMELALACDIRVASKNAKVGLPEVGLGIYPGYGGTQRLPRLIGVGMAKKLIFTGAPISAEEGYRIGLFEHLSEEGMALEDAQKIARQIAQVGPVAVKIAKKIINQGIELSLNEGISLESANFGDICETQDKTEGAKAFLEKRKPVFAGI